MHQELRLEHLHENKMAGGMHSNLLPSFYFILFIYNFIFFITHRKIVKQTLGRNVLQKMNIQGMYKQVLSAPKY